jgi:hypothetical protein
MKLEPENQTERIACCLAPLLCVEDVGEMARASPLMGME